MAFNQAIPFLEDRSDAACRIVVKTARLYGWHGMRVKSSGRAIINGNGVKVRSLRSVYVRFAEGNHISVNCEIR